MSRYRDAPYLSLAQIMAGIATPGEGGSVVVSGDGTSPPSVGLAIEDLVRQEWL